MHQADTERAPLDKFSVLRKRLEAFGTPMRLVLRRPMVPECPIFQPTLNGQSICSADIGYKAS